MSYNLENILKAVHLQVRRQDRECFFTVADNSFYSPLIG